MYCIDLNFLKEDEVEAIVAVIEKDFEVKAAEKARICRLRKQLINKDHKAELLSQSPFEGSFCVLCCSKFFIIINPKRVCSSCGMQICNSCCLFVKNFNQIICLICQQQHDLMAMNCSWFYETIRRKFMEGGSQIVANSLSEYPRKNAISPYILNMVKGAQITKFRHQIEDASSSILDSLRKVECITLEEDIKSIKYTELIKKFTENLKMILHNIFQVLHITLENYNKKVGVESQNIDIQVMRILHEEIELLVGKKINIKPHQDKLKKSRRSYETMEIKESLIIKLASAVVEKLVADHQLFLIETRQMQYDDLNIVLKNIVKNESMDFDYDSISQAPSRQGTIHRPHTFKIFPEPLPEISPVESDDSSKLYSLSGVGERTTMVSKQWNEHASRRESINDVSNRDDTDFAPAVPSRLKKSNSRRSRYDGEMKIDSDVLTMPARQNEQTNWLMNARQPFGSLNSINIDSNDPYSNWNKLKSEKRASSQMNLENVAGRRFSDNRFGSLSNIHIEPNDPYIIQNKNKVKRNPNQRPPSHHHVDVEFEVMFNENRNFVKDSQVDNIDEEFKKNLRAASGIPNNDGNFRLVERIPSQDSGVGLSQISITKPEPRSQATRKSEAPRPTAKKTQILKPKIVTAKPRSNSNSSVDSDSKNILSSARASIKVSRKGRFK